MKGEERGVTKSQSSLVYAKFTAVAASLAGWNKKLNSGGNLFYCCNYNKLIYRVFRS